jgi:hypothetical protein
MGNAKEEGWEYGKEELRDIQDLLKNNRDIQVIDYFPA